MGCDGGTIPTRDELVKTKKKPEKKDKSAVISAKWKHCAISQEPLRTPIIACELGSFYNKESILEFLLDKSIVESTSRFEHIRGLKDVKELNFTDNPAFKKEDETRKGTGYNDSHTGKYICPIVGVEMNGKSKFCYLWSCGCVLSDRSLREVKGEICHKCNKKFDSADIVILNGDDSEVTDMKVKMEARRAKAKASKKAKRAMKEMTCAASESSTAQSSDTQPNAKKSRVDSSSSDLKEISEAACSSTSTCKSRKVASKLNAGTERLCDGQKTSDTKSIQDDPKASKAYKSLFTTSAAAKNQQQPHWITFNPLYY